jgi:MFS family permease
VSIPTKTTGCIEHGKIGAEMVASVSTWAGILFSIPAGLLSDRFGRKTMLTAAGFIFASAPAMYLITTHIWQLVALRFYHGLATAIFMPSYRPV